MNNPEMDQLERETTRGRQAQTAYDTFIGPFIEDKRTLLWETFQDVSIVETDHLQEVKRQLMVINALDTEIKTVIDTGKLASQQIANAPQSKY